MGLRCFLGLRSSCVLWTHIRFEKATRMGERNRKRKLETQAALWIVIFFKCSFSFVTQGTFCGIPYVLFFRPLPKKCARNQQRKLTARGFSFDMMLQRKHLSWIFWCKVFQLRRAKGTGLHVVGVGGCCCIPSVSPPSDIICGGEATAGTRKKEAVSVSAEVGQRQWFENHPFVTRPLCEKGGSCRSR